MDEREVVLAVECSEPQGKIIRHVSLSKLSIEKIKFYWEKMKKFDVLFNDHVKGDFRAFVNHFVVQIDGEAHPAGLIWDVDNVGVFILNDIRPTISAQAHFVFWDKISNGREELCRRMVEYAFNTYKFVRLEVNVPVYASITMRDVERIGFSLEGRKRDASLYRGSWYDVNIYSMIPGDLAGSEAFSLGYNEKNVICVDCRTKFKKKHHPKPMETEVTHGT